MIMISIMCDEYMETIPLEFVILITMKVTSNRAIGCSVLMVHLYLFVH